MVTPSLPFGFFVFFSYFLYGFLDNLNLPGAQCSHFHPFQSQTHQSGHSFHALFSRSVLIIFRLLQNINFQKTSRVIPGGVTFDLEPQQDAQVSPSIASPSVVTSSIVTSSIVTSSIVSTPKSCHRRPFSELKQ